MDNVKKKYLREVLEECLERYGMSDTLAFIWGATMTTPPSKLDLEWAREELKKIGQTEKGG